MAQLAAAMRLEPGHHVNGRGENYEDMEVRSDGGTGAGGDRNVGIRGGTPDYESPGPMRRRKLRRRSSRAHHVRGSAPERTRRQRPGLRGLSSAQRQSATFAGERTGPFRLAAMAPPLESP